MIDDNYLDKVLIDNSDELEFLDMIDELHNDDRRMLREMWIQQGVADLPRNLWYNYTSQEWID